MQQFSVFQKTDMSHGTPPLRGRGVNSAWLGGVEFFSRGQHSCNSHSNQRIFNDDEEDDNDCDNSFFF